MLITVQKGKSVGMGTVTEGSNLHGHAIPQGYVNVIIDYIQPNILLLCLPAHLTMKKCSQLDNSQHGQQVT